MEMKFGIGFHQTLRFASHIRSSSSGSYTHGHLKIVKRRGGGLARGEIREVWKIKKRKIMEEINISKRGYEYAHETITITPVVKYRNIAKKSNARMRGHVRKLRKKVRMSIRG